MKIKVRDAKVLCEQAILAIEKCEATGQKAFRNLRDCESKCREEIEFFNRIDPEHELDIDELKGFREAYTILRIMVEKQYSYVARVPDISSFQIESELDSDDLEEILRSNSIEVGLEDSGIFIRLPMLWSRNKAENVSLDKFYKVSLRSKIFRESVQTAIKTAPNFEQYPFEKYLYKTINYCFVYPRKGMSELYISDTDNHETKSITDAICHYLPKKDSGLYTDFSYKTIATDAIPEGTYITVLPQADMRMAQEQLLEYWQNRGCRK